MDIKALMQKYGVTVGVAGGCLVVGSQFGSCTVDPIPPAPKAETAPAEAEAEKPEEAEETEETEESVVVAPASGEGSE
tara:strand:- start:12698 stop:12931 length:234 start_codon:yes stop_codon:yes gene_type:complete